MWWHEIAGRCLVTTIRILISSPIPLYRDGLALLLAQEPGIEVVGTAATAEDCISVIEGLDLDLVLADVALPQSIDVLREFCDALAPQRVLAMFVPEEEGTVMACACAGVIGFVARDATMDDL